MMPILLIVFGLATFGVVGGFYIASRKPRSTPEPAPAEPELADRAIVTITGTVQILGEPLISPLSARRCVMYESYANLYEPISEDRDPETKRTLIAQLAKRAMIPFGLETALGVIVVDGTEADLELVPTPVFPRRPEREMAFLREHDRAPALADTTTFEEISVDPDSLVSVRGMALVEGEPPNHKIRLVAHGEQQPLTIGTPRRTTVQRH